MIKKISIILGVLLVVFLVFKVTKKIDFNSKHTIGEKIDSLHHVYVYYNGGVDNVTERNTEDGYNLGLKYQCVEFVKRYYYEHYKHKMPDSYGHAKSFFEAGIADGEKNSRRNLYQYQNPSATRPKIGDLVVFKGTLFNTYGHVAIISDVNAHSVEFIQQNPGPFSPSRETFQLSKQGEKFKIAHERVLGWLRK